ncbi:MAG: restriction endonuclease, SacI family [Thermoleophilia bacterium]
MGLTIDKKRARKQLERALTLARSDTPVPSAWTERTERVAQFEDKTCLVVLGTALLATATDDAVDALTLKARAGNKAYSARGLAHDVLVPAAINHGFDLRTTGREPLNNQPFFYSDRVDSMPRVKHPDEIQYLVECLEAVHYLREEEAVGALAAFLRHRIAAKERLVPVDLGNTSADVIKLKDACSHFLNKSAESGKRAQALVAAAFDLVFDDVRTARVFDPSRKLPGDVQAFYKLDPVIAVEVRAKPVTYSDAVHFVRSVAAAGFPHAMIAGFDSVAAEVQRLSQEAWEESGVYVTVYTRFSDMLLDALAWSRRPLHQLLAEFPRNVVARLIQLEVKTSSMALWGELVS